MADEAREQSFAAAIARLHAAMAKVAAGDHSAIKALHSHREDVTGFYGWGGYEEGWDAVSRRWDWAVTRFSGEAVSYCNLASFVSADLAYSVDIETFTLPGASGGPAASRSNRVTHVFRFEDGEWRLIHRHASRLEDRPAG